MPIQQTISTGGGTRTNNNAKLLLVVLVLLNIADALITQFIVLSGFGFEGNSVMASWINHGQFVPLKASAAILIAFILWELYRRIPKPTMFAIVTAVVFYTAVVGWNVFVAARAL